jgi:hypothetical protein
MKRILTSAALFFLVTGAALMSADVARAVHIGIYPDATGSTCNLQPGLSSTATIIQKFTLGATGSRFKMDLSLCPGTSFFAFSSPFFTIGVLTTDMSIGYGQCLTGNIVLGTILANWAPGTVSIVAADLQSNIYYTDCSYTELPATGGHASISGDGHGCDFDAVQPSTWGGVKALYRD